MGEIIVARECLADGPVDKKPVNEFFEIRAEFIAAYYAGFTKVDYQQNTVPEFRKIQKIPKGAEVNLWFEDDLFCQVNLWFVCNLLKEDSESNSINLIRPVIHTRYGFGGLSEDELLSIFNNRKKLEHIEKLAELWWLYQNKNTSKMLEIGKQLESDLPFILPAIQAHIDRNPSGGNPGRPVQSLKEIKEEFNTEDFGVIFREFSIRENMYGFGDLQVKRLLEELL